MILGHLEEEKLQVSQSPLVLWLTMYLALGKCPCLHTLSFTATQELKGNLRGSSTDFQGQLVTTVQDP